MKTKKQRSMAAVLVTALLLGTLSIPGGTVSHAASKLKVTAPKTVAVNQTVTIKTNVTAKFKSGNKKIATVSSKGVVKGKKAGKVKITVTSKSNKDQKKTVTITVQNKLVITEPANAKAALKVDETVKIKTNLSSRFSSSNDSVAQVSSNGTVTAKSKGTATITVTAKKYKNLVKKVTVTVEEQTEATTQVPTTEKPTSEVPTTENSTTENKTSEQPETEKPTSEDKITEKPTSEQLTTEDTSGEEIIIISEEPTSEEPTTEKPTTERPTTEKPTEKPTTEKPTTEKPTTEKPTTEKPTTEKPTTEKPTTETPTTETPTSEEPTEEKTVVGIEANYGNNKVPYMAVDYLFTSRDVTINLLYDDGTKEELTIDKSSLANVVKKKVEEVDYGAIVTYMVFYNQFSCSMTIEYIYTDDIYPIGINVYSTGKIKKVGDTDLASDEYKVLVTYSDGTAEYVDNSNCRYAYIQETEEKGYDYLIIYDCYFTDSNGNELYVGKSIYFSLPYE